MSRYYTDFKTVAASQTDQMMGPNGAAGDILSRLIIIPATTSPGAVSIEYGATNIVVYTGGTVGADLTPIVLELGIRSPSGGGWEITTGANVSCIAIGSFS